MILLFNIDFKFRAKLQNLEQKNEKKVHKVC